MNKQEATKYLAEKRAEGYLTHSTLLELCNNKDDIPNEVIEACLYSKLKPKEIVILTSSEGIEEFNKAIENYAKTNNISYGK